MAKRKLDMKQMTKKLRKQPNIIDWQKISPHGGYQDVIWNKLSMIQYIILISGHVELGD